MNDSNIRTVLREELNKKYAKDKNTLVLDELGVGHGTARIDLVVVNSCLHGYEIKSDVDSLKRLPDQIRIFSSVVDRMTLVVGYKHAYNALKMIPEWWGVKIAEENKRNGNVILTNARFPHNNPEIDLKALVALLWRDEALNILEEMGAASGVRSKTRTEIYERLVQVSNPELLRARVRQQLKRRVGWRVGVQQMSCGD